MNEFWSLNHRFSIWSTVAILSLLCQRSIFGWSLNEEGIALLRFKDRIVNDPFGALSSWNGDIGEKDPCSWFGIECADGNVISLKLKALCLEGTVAPELVHLIHLKSIVLRCNSFSGVIPEEVSELKELEVLDLGYNNLSGPLPPLSETNLSILLLDRSGFFLNLSPEIKELMFLSEAQLDETQLTWMQGSFCCSISDAESVRHDRRKLQNLGTLTMPILPPPLFHPPSPRLNPKSPVPPPRLNPKSPVPPPPHYVPPPPQFVFSSPPSQISPTPVSNSPSSSASSANDSKLKVVLPAVVVPLFLALVIGIILYRRQKLAIVGPWRTGLSSQLQKAFLTDVPKLKWSDIQNACEDFSNVIGSSSLGTIYKGTLSNGVEIAVISLPVKSAKDWSQIQEEQFRQKIDTLSTLNHKNFVNLLGCCEEDEPFWRMMVFEYAPNGTLFEHLHIQEAEHLDWKVRLRTAMGIAYCLEHMHNLSPPVAHKNLSSSSVALTEDYSAKISYFSFSHEMPEASPQLFDMEILTASSSSLEADIFSFGILLLELITGRMPSSSVGSFEDSEIQDYLSGKKPLRQLVDPTLSQFSVEHLGGIDEVIKSCVNPDLECRPKMREVTERLKAITTIGPEAATPTQCPIWWAEIEVLGSC